MQISFNGKRKKIVLTHAVSQYRCIVTFVSKLGDERSERTVVDCPTAVTHSEHLALRNVLLDRMIEDRAVSPSITLRT